MVFRTHLLLAFDVLSETWEQCLSAISRGFVGVYPVLHLFIYSTNSFEHLLWGAVCARMSVCPNALSPVLAYGLDQDARPAGSNAGNAEARGGSVTVIRMELPVNSTGWVSWLRSSQFCFGRRLPVMAVLCAGTLSIILQHKRKPKLTICY